MEEQVDNQNIKIRKAMKGRDTEEIRKRETEDKKEIETERGREMER